MHTNPILYESTIFELDTLIGLFMTAALQGDWKRAKAILESHNSSLCLQDELGWSILHHVSDFHHVRNIGQRMLGDENDEEGRQTIDWNDRHCRMVQLLLEHHHPDSLSEDAQFHQDLWKARDLRDGTNPLHVACSSGAHVSVIRVLAAHARNAGYEISYVVDESNKDPAICLINTNNLYTTPDGNNKTLLHVAAEYGHAEIVQELLQNVLTVEEETKRELRGAPAVSLVAEQHCDHDTADATTYKTRNQPQESDTIVDHDDKPNKAFPFISSDNAHDETDILCVDPRLGRCQPSHKTPLHLACEWGRQEVVQTLLAWMPKSSTTTTAKQDEFNSHQHQKEEKTNSRILFLLQLIGAQDDRGETPVHTALQCGYVSCAMEILNALQEALRAENYTTDLLVAAENKRMLHGRVSEVMCIRDHQGDTALHLLARRMCDHSTTALQQQDRVVCRLLLSLGRMPIIDDASHESKSSMPSSFSPSEETQASCSLLAVANNRGETALHEASRHGNLIAVQEILNISQKKEIVDLPSPKGMTALMLSLPHAVVFHTLLQHIPLGKPANLRQCEEGSGDTILHLAVRQKAEASIIKALLQRDTGLVQHRNKEGQTPFMMAARENMFQAVHLMVSHCHMELFSTSSGV